MLNNENVFYLDETGINLHLKRVRAWCKKGQIPRIDFSNSKGQNISILAVMGKSGIFHYGIKSGSYKK